jgi:hypothetical protein
LVILNNLSESDAESYSIGESFYVRQMAWQRGNYITRQWDVSLTCGLSTEGMGCIGELENGSAIAIYLR